MARPLVVVQNDTIDYVLQVIDDTGCVAFDTITVFGLPLPNAPLFTFTPDSVCAPTNTSFTIQSPDSNCTYVWNFDGQFITAGDTSFSFDAIGVNYSFFVAGLTKIDTNGCSSISQQTVAVQQRPDPNLVDPVTNFTNCLGDTFTLTVFNTSTPIAGIVSYSLDWGDGSPLWTGAFFPGAGLTHTYNSTGLFNILFTATGSNGCTFTRTIPLNNTTNPAIAVGSPGATSGCAPQTFCFPLLNFQGNASNTRYFVSFGDGSGVTVYNHPPPDTICHTYGTTSCDAPGSPPIFPPDAWIFSITAVNVCDSTPAAVGGIRVYTLPESRFDIVDDTGCFQDSFIFVNQSTPGFNNNCDSTDFFLWNLGDGTIFNTSDFSPQSHQYANPGEYIVTLTASDFCGINVYVDTLCAQDTPIASFIQTPDSGCAPLFVDMTNTSNVLTDCGDYLMTWSVRSLGGGCNTGPSWVFRDSTNTNSIDPRFTFNTSGRYEIELIVMNTCGMDTIYDTVTVQEPPGVTLQQPTDFCDTALYSPIVIYDLCEDDTISYNWSFSGGIPAVSTDSLPDSIVYNIPGNYQVIISATNTCGTTSDSASFFVHSLPEANFSATLPCLGTPVNFTDLTIAGNPFGAGAQNWNWDFGDLNNSTQQNPSNNYAVYGTYNVNLLVTDSNGCVDDTTQTITVNPLPVPAFSWTSVCFGDPTVFTDLSTIDTAFIGNIVSWNWDFGDGGTSTNQNPSYTYTGFGFFNVTLTITDDNGCTDSVTNVVRVYPSPIANFSAPDVCIGDSSFFTDLTFVDPLGTPLVSWNWNFGDGSGTSTQQNPVYIYSATGTYNVTLTVTDSFGCTDDTTIQVVVNVLPDASFTAVPTIGCHPLSVQLTHTGSPGVNHFWYDNGILVSNQTSPLLILTNPSSTIDANHVIMHVVEAGTSCTDTIMDTILVWPKPTADFSFIPSNLCAPDSIVVTNTSLVKGPGTFLWTVNSTAVTISNPTGNMPTFFFPDNQSGVDTTYSVSLIVTSVDGCSDTLTRTITLWSRPIVDFSVDSTVCGPTTIIPTNNSTGTGLNYAWSINPIAPINNPALAQPQISLPVSLLDSVIYMVNLTVTDANGCIDTDSQQVILYPKPTADFTPVPTDSCGPVTVTFNNISTPNNGTETIASMTFTWDFGNGQTSTAQDPIVTFTNTGVIDSIYTVTLIARTQHGCLDTVTNSVTVYPDPRAEFTSAFQADCAPFTIDTSIITTIQYPIANDAYAWYADGVFLGNGILFPGFTIPSGPDTVTIRLITTNVHGCTPDTFDVDFRTIEKPVAGFSLPINAGCHPLSINPVDTSTPGVNHSWFIDGTLVSNLQNPTLTFRNNSNTQDSVQTLTLIVTAGSGCSDTTSQTVTVYPKPLADFIVIPPAACAPAAIIIGDSSDVKGPATYTWTVNSSAVIIIGGATSNPNFIFPDNQSGVDSTYQITLVIGSVDGCLDTATNPVTIYSRPVAGFTVTDSFCGPASFGINNTSTGTGLNYSWLISGAGSVTNGTTGNPTFDVPVSNNDSVIYTITLAITDTNGCVDTFFEDFTLYPKPTANFTAASFDSCGPLTIQFNNLSTPNNGLETIASMSFNWDFGNGQTSTLQDPTATFTNTGVIDSIYIVELIAQTQHGCLDTLYDTVTVFPNPRAEFNATSQVDCAPFVIDSTNITLVPYPNANDSYTWLVNGVVVGTGTTFPGFTIAVDGDTANIQLVAQNVHACQPDTFGLQFITIENPIAGFSAPFYNGCHPLTIPFTDTSTPGVNHNWYINGQLVSNLASPTLTFFNNSNTTDSIQTVRLIVTAGSGCSDTTDQTITVYPQPQAFFQFNRNPACSGDTVSALDASAVKGAATYQWSVIPSGSVTITGANTANPIFAFDDNQSQVDTAYQVTLVITSIDGCTDTINRNITVLSRPLADFTIDTANCGPASFSPLNNSLGVVPSWAWTIDPVAAIDDSTLQTPLFSFPISLADSVLYSVNLLVTDIRGCVDSATFNTIIWPQPIAGFTASNTDSCGPLTVTFTNTSDPNNFGETIDSMTFSWNFGNGQTSNLQDPVVVFSNTGLDDSIYIVELIAFSEHGCADTIYDTITVFPNPVAQFNAPFTIDCAPFVLDSNLITGVDFPTANDNYTWLADGVVIGNGLSFPGYTIPFDGDTVAISLVATDIEGCSPDTFTLDFITIEDPVANFSLNPQAGCSPLLVNAIDSSTPGVTWAWYSDGVLTDTVQNPSFTFTNSSNLIDSLYDVTLIITAAGSGCSDTLTQTVRVFNIPLVDAGADFDICVNDTVFTIVSGSPAGGLWSGTGIVNPTGDFDPGIAGIGPHILTYTYTDSSGCVASDSLTVNVLGLPLINAGQDTTVCDQAIPVQLFGNPAGGLWTGPTITPGGNFVPSNLGLGNYTMTYSATDTNGCTNSDSLIVTVIAPTFANAGITDTICLNNGPDTIAGFSPAGGFWTGPGIIDSTLGVFEPALAGVGTQALVYTFGVQTCLTRDTNEYFVWPLPQVDFTNTLTCIGDTTFFTDLSIPNAAGLVSWNWNFGDGNSDTIQNPSHVYAVTGVYPVTLTVTNTNGCSNDSTKNAITNPLPNLNFSFPAVACEDDSVFFVLDTIDAVIYTWFWGDGDSSTGANPFHIYDSPGQYTITLFATTAAGCSDSTSALISISDDPTAFFTPDPDTGCGPLAVDFFPIPPATPYGGYTYYWEFGQGDTAFTFIPPTITFPAGINGDSTFTVEYRVYSFVCQTVAVYFDDIVTSPIPLAAVATDVDSGCSPLLVTFNNQSRGLADSFYIDFGDGTDTSITNLLDFQHSFSNSGVVDSFYTVTIYAFNDCGTDTTDLTITVYPNSVIADITAINPVGCQNDSFFFASNPTGAFFIYYDFGDGSPVLASSDSIINHVYVDSGIFNVIQTVYSNDSCSVNFDTVQVTVNGLPTTNAGQDTAVCDQAIPVSLFGLPAGGVWGDTLISSAGVFLPDSLGIGNTQFYYTYTHPVTGCIGIDSMIVTVNNTVFADAGTDDTICIDNGILNLNGGNPGGGFWTGIGLVDSFSGQFSPDSSGVGTFELVYTFGVQTCLTRDSVIVHVDPLPVVDAGADDTLCFNNGIFTIVSGSPAGVTGVWTGLGIIAASGDFDPTVAGVGDHVLTYTYTDPGTGCINSDTLTMTVLALPFVDAGQDTTVCDQAIPVQLFGLPVGGTWTGNSISPTGQFLPNNLAIGNTRMYYTVQDPLTGCFNTDSMTVTTNPTVFADAGPNDSICIDNGLFNLPGLPAGGFWTGNGVVDSAGIFDPAVVGVGVYTLTYTFGVQTCLTRDSFDLTVNPLPVVFPGPNIVHCINDPFITLTSATPSGGVYTGPGVIDPAGVINPRAAGVGVHTIIYTYAHPVTGCVNVDSFTLTINDIPTSLFSFTPADFGCQGPVTVTMVDQSVGAVTYFWDFDDGQTSTAPAPTVTYAGVGAYDVMQVVTNIEGCRDTSFNTFNVYPFPVIGNITASPDEGCEPLTVTFTPQTQFATRLFWDFGDGNVTGAVGTGPITHVYQFAGTYDVTLRAISQGDCGDTVTVVSAVTVRPRPTADFSWTTNTIPFAFGGQADFTNMSIDGVRYLWHFGDGDTSTLENPTHIYDNLQGDIDVMLVTWNIWGCPDTIIQTIYIPKYVKGLFIPNALSPEFGVGEVRVFQPKGVGLETYHISVYNNWGELLWESTLLIDTEPAEFWDGTFNGALVPQDAYMWKCEATFLDGTVWQGMQYGNGGFKRFGTVTVIR